MWFRIGLAILGLLCLCIYELQAQCTDDTHSSNELDTWLSCQMTPCPNPIRGNGHWIVYDLGYVYQLKQTTFWNYNVAGQTGNGFKDVYIDYSVDGIAWTQAATFQLPQAPANSAYTGFIGPDLGGISARYVLIFAENTWNGGSCAGLSECRIDVGANCPNGDNDNDGMCDVAMVTLKVFLEGAMMPNGTQMRTTLNDENLLPLSQPYNIAPYNYNNTVSVTVFPSTVVDWVLVEARSGTPNLSGNAQTILIESQVGLLHSNGEISDLSGNAGLRFANLIEGNEYYFLVRHRNHMDVVSSTAVSINNLTANFDFSSSVGQALGTNQLKVSSAGVYMLHSGDYNYDGSIQNTDYDVWKVNPSILRTYHAADGNLDGTVQVTDFDQWHLNKAKLGVGEVQF